MMYSLDLHGIKHFHMLQHTLSCTFESHLLNTPNQPTLSTGEVIGIKVFACFGYAICFLYFCFLIVMRKRVQVQHTFLMFLYLRVSIYHVLHL